MKNHHVHAFVTSELSALYDWRTYSKDPPYSKPSLSISLLLPACAIFHMKRCLTTGICFIWKTTFVEEEITVCSSQRSMTFTFANTILLLGQ